MHAAAVELLELVAIHRVGGVGEVRIEIETIVHRVAVHTQGPGTKRLPPARGEAIAVGFAAIGGVVVAEAADGTGSHRTAGNLVGRIPLPAIAHGQQVEAAIGVAPRVLDDAIHFCQIFGKFPGPGGARGVCGDQEVAPGECPGGTGEGAGVAVLPAGHERQVVFQAAAIVHIDSADCREVAVLGVVSALTVFDALDQFRNHEIDVAIALTMGVGGQVDWQPLYACGQVRTVVEVEPAQEKLVGLAPTTMLRNDEAWHYLEHFADALQWPGLELFGQYRADRSGGYQPCQPVDTARRDNDLVEFARHAGSVRRWGTGASRYGSQKGRQHGGC